MILVPIVDPATHQQVNKLMMWDGEKKWWTSEQEVPLTFIQHQEINSVITAYGTDGQFIYPLFKEPSIHFAKTAQSKLWMNPGSYHLEKAAVRLWGLVHYYSADAPDIVFSIDNENDLPSVTVESTSTEAMWLNNASAVATWQNGLGQTATWQSSNVQTGIFLSGGQRVSVGPPSVHWKNYAGDDANWENISGNPAVWTTTGLGLIDPTAVGQQGVILGLTFTTLAADLAIVSTMLQTEVVGYRG